MGENQHENQDIYQLIAEYSRDLISIHSPEGDFQYLSPSVKDLLGYEPEELIGVNPYKQLFHQEDFKRIQEESHKKALEGVQDNRIEYRILHKNGYYVWFESFTNPIYDDNGEIKKLLVSSRDITEKKEAEIFLDETGRIAEVGGWQLTLQNLKLEWTKETYRIHEVPVDETIDIEKAINFYHPDYREKIRTALNTLIEEGEPYDLEAKIMTRTGKEKWVRAKGVDEEDKNKRTKVWGTFQDITDRKTMEEKLKANEIKNQHLIDNAQDLIFWLDPNGYFTYLNPVVFKITGYTERELKNEHFATLLEEKEFHKANQWLESLLGDDTPQFYDEIQIVTKNGEKKWLGLHVQRIESNEEIKELSALARDITERVNAEEALKATTSRLNTLIEHLHSGILMENENQEVIMVNQAFNDMFNLPYKKEALIGDDCAKLFKQAKDQFSESETFENAVYELKADQKLKLGEEWTLANGKIFEQDYIPIFQENQCIGHLWQYHDVTQRKTEEIELVKAKEEAEKASHAKADFLSTMSHEIRTPLNSVIGISHLLLQENPKPEQLENLKALKFSGENLLNLINDILDFNKIEAGKIDLENETFNLNGLVHSIQKTHSFKADEKGLQLKTLIDDQFPSYVKGDKTRISQILSNLVSNALKFTDSGEVAIEAKKQEEETDRVSIYFAVIDTGIGIPEEKLESIFQSFTQASKSTSRQFGGTGLGLSISKRLLELQNSDLKVQSEVGKGTRFEFTLCLEKGAQPVITSEEEVEKPDEFAPKLAGRKVLLVEDNDMNIFMANQFLKGWKMEVTNAKTGKEALTAASADRFDLILMDLQMPEMDGYEATKKLRAMKPYKTTPIIALTASAFIEVQSKVYNAGMNDYVTKPFNPTGLYQKLVQNS